MTYLALEESELILWDIRYRRGWLGAFTREQAPEATYANGARIRKANSELGDRVRDGTTGTVLGSIKAPDEPACGYFVEWDNCKRIAVFLVEARLTAIEKH